MIVAPRATGQDFLPLWNGTPPFAQASDTFTAPGVFPYTSLEQKADKKATAVLICPGGGYNHLAMEHEGHQVAQWLNGLGIKAFVLRYRHHGEGFRHPVPLADAQRAIRLLKSRAEEWAIDPSRVGVMGFSAGGHLAASLATQWKMATYGKETPADRLSARPAFLALLYPVISMDDSITHKGSRWHLLGDAPSEDKLHMMSPEKNLSTETPTTFLAHAATDPVVPAANSQLFYQALQAQGVSAELHLFAKGGHGMGMRQEYPWAHWQILFEAWLRSQGLL